MPSFSALISDMTITNGQARLTGPDDWLQGRTLYGGLSAALSHEVALQHLGRNLPLRSAQIAFIGPATGNLQFAATTLRQGRSVSYVNVDLSGEKGLAVRTLFCFGDARPSALTPQSCPMPDIRSPQEADTFLPPEIAPRFMSHFDLRLAGGSRPGMLDPTALIQVWARHKDNRATSAGQGGIMNALLAMADALPPAIITTLPTMVPLSSMTWQVDVLSTDIASSLDGWWLLETQAQSASNGYSAQKMMVWSEDGTAVLAARQAVAVFG